MTALEQISHMTDVPIAVDIELDRRVMSLREILELEAGAVIKMSRSAGENIDVLVGGSVLGYGEIVIIEDTVGVRITDFNNEE
jgi:flagellar motor switch protein FliN/FliY